MIEEYAGGIRYDKRYTGWLVASVLATLLGIMTVLLSLFGGVVYGVPIGISIFFVLVTIGCAGLTTHFIPRAFYRGPVDLDSLEKGRYVNYILGGIFAVSIIGANFLYHILSWKSTQIELLVIFGFAVLIIAILYSGWWGGKTKAELEWRTGRGYPETDLPYLVGVITKKSERRALLLFAVGLILIILISQFESIFTAIGTVAGIFGILNFPLYFIPETVEKHTE